VLIKMTPSLSEDFHLTPQETADLEYNLLTALETARADPVAFSKLHREICTQLFKRLPPNAAEYDFVKNLCQTINTLSEDIEHQVHTVVEVQRTVSKHVSDPNWFYQTLTISASVLYNLMQSYAVQTLISQGPSGTAAFIASILSSSVKGAMDVAGASAYAAGALASSMFAGLGNMTPTFLHSLRFVDVGGLISLLIATFYVLYFLKDSLRTEPKPAALMVTTAPVADGELRALLMTGSDTAMVEGVLVTPPRRRSRSRRSRSRSRSTRSRSRSR
jgi:UDP-glucose 4-epimerase